MESRTALDLLQGIILFVKRAGAMLTVLGFGIYSAIPGDSWEGSGDLSRSLR